MHKDVHVQDIDNDTTKTLSQSLNKSQLTADIKRFFKLEPDKCDGSKGRASCICCECVFELNAIVFNIICIHRKGTGGCPKKESTFVEEVTTLRRHMASQHSVRQIL